MCVTNILSNHVSNDQPTSPIKLTDHHDQRFMYSYNSLKLR